MSNLINILKNNNYELTKEDIENNKSDLGIKDNSYGNTVLMYYLWLNKNPNFEIIKSLEKEKDILNYNNFTPLMHYCRNLNIKNINTYIIKYFSNQIGLKDNNGETALMYYLEKNKNPIIEIIKLLEKEKDIFDASNFTPLMCYFFGLCSKKINLEIINYFSNQIGKQNKYGDTALHYYLKYNKNPNFEIIKLLEKEKDILNYNNFTPLMFYCMNENIEYLNIELIKYFSKKINKNNYGYAALYYYLKYNKNPYIDDIKLLEEEKDISNNMYETPLMYYCMNENIEYLNIEIINYYSNQIGKQNKYGNNALHYYLKYNENPYIEDIKYLYREIGYIDFKSYNLYLDIY